MNPTIEILINDKYSSFELDSENLPKDLDFLLKKADIGKISSVSITDNIILVLNGDVDFCSTKIRSKNNINAFDRQGNLKWNISDIVGSLKVPFMGGRLWTRAKYQEFLDSDICKYSTKINHYIDGHLLYTCYTDPKGYIIDLVDNKVLWEYPCR